LPVNSESTVLLDGLVFPEGLRWHNGKLWFSDMWGGRVMTVDLAGRTEIIAQFDDEPSGLGFLPDGTPIVVLMHRRQVVRLVAGRAEIHADLSLLSDGFANDMVVDDDGVAYVGFFVLRRPGEQSGECIAKIDVEGNASIATSHVSGPNGLAITPDHRTLIYASTPGRQLIALTIERDGTLSNPEIFAEMATRPDGISLDAEGAIWTATLEGNACLRIAKGGQVKQSVSVGDRWAIACTLGGPDRSTLFVATAQVTQDHMQEHRLVYETRSGQARWRGKPPEGFIQIAQVNMPGAGWP
jgi:sugar lactone lactonase YvrE